MVTAVETVPGCDPDRAGFTVALEAARDTVITIAGTTATAAALFGRPDLVGHIGTRVLRALLPKRRMRLSARIVKCGTSRYAIWNRDERPRDSTPITAIVITVHPPTLPTAHAPDRALSGRWGQVCRVLAENSNQTSTPATSQETLASPPPDVCSAASTRSSATGHATADSSAQHRVRTSSLFRKGLTTSTESQLRGIGRPSAGGSSLPAARPGPPTRPAPEVRHGPRPIPRPSCPTDIGAPGSDDRPRSRTCGRGSHTTGKTSWTTRWTARKTAAPGPPELGWIRHPRAVWEAPAFLPRPLEDHPPGQPHSNSRPPRSLEQRLLSLIFNPARHPTC